MSTLKETTAAGLKTLRAATDPTDVVRKGELDTALAAYSTTSAMNTAIADKKHDAVTVADTNSIDLTITGQALSADLKLKASSVVQASGGPTTEDFQDVVAGSTLTLAKQSVTVASAQLYTQLNPNLTLLVATGVEDTDYEVNASLGTVFIPTGSNLIPSIEAQFVRITYSYGQLTEGSGLTVDATGTSVNAGTSHHQMARGDHSHANDHKAATGQTTNSGTVVVSGGQKISFNLTANADTLEVTASGVGVKSGVFAEAAHTHAVVTAEANGLMSPAMLASLNAVSSAAFNDSTTVAVTTEANGTFTPAVKLGAGITTDGSGVAVDYTAVAAKVHTHTANVQNFRFTIDGHGSAITTGVKGHIEIPLAGTITKVTLLADQSGSIVVDLWKAPYSAFPPVDANSITSSSVPTISTATKYQNSTLTGWTKSVSAGDIIAYNVDSASTITRLEGFITLQPS